MSRRLVGHELALADVQSSGRLWRRVSHGSIVHSAPARIGRCLRRRERGLLAGTSFPSINCRGLLAYWCRSRDLNPMSLRTEDFKPEKKRQQLNVLSSCCLFSLRGLRVATVFYEGYGHRWTPAMAPPSTRRRRANCDPRRSLRLSCEARGYFCAVQSKVTLCSVRPESGVAPGGATALQTEVAGPVSRIATPFRGPAGQVVQAPGRSPVPPR